MNPLSISVPRMLFAGILMGCAACAAETPPQAWQDRHDRLVLRLRNLSAKEGLFGAPYQPLYHAALPWYELWGGRDPSPVDADMVSPEDYATELAGSLEAGRNYFAENPGALFPLVFRKTLPGGRQVGVNYWLALPAGFPGAGRTFPLVVGLHGSGWLGHKISFKRGTGPGGRTFAVVPIDMGGPWQIDFLNAYLDELIAILPIDTDRIYVEGHSLGAMATWEWALDNPGRFAAISPRAGVGEPYRAVRLKNVPSWVIHGEDDAVIPNGFADQMVSALQSEGSAVRYTLIKGGEHNMPADLDEDQVVDWYLRQSRSHRPPPADPRDSLGLNAAGFSPWEIIERPAAASWKTQPLDLSSREKFRDAARILFQKAHDRGMLVDSPIREELDPVSHLSTLWLSVPRSLHPGGGADPSAVVLPAARCVRFYYRGDTKSALEHLREISPELAAGGHAVAGSVWITHLTIWQDTPAAIAEYWVNVTQPDLKGL